jgi:putative oxidoreductase
MSSNSGSISHRALGRAATRGLDLTLWALQVLIALVFLIFGANKLDPRSHIWAALFGTAGGSFWIDVFAKIGIGQWFRYFTGCLETVCAILLLIPRTATIAAVLLSCTMIGAILTHIFLLRNGLAIVWVCVVVLFITSAIAWNRRKLLPNLGGLRRTLAGGRVYGSSK